MMVMFLVSLLEVRFCSEVSYTSELDVTSSLTSPPVLEFHVTLEPYDLVKELLLSRIYASNYSGSVVDEVQPVHYLLKPLMQKKIILNWFMEYFARFAKINIFSFDQRISQIKFNFNNLIQRTNLFCNMATQFCFDSMLQISSSSKDVIISTLIINSETSQINLFNYIYGLPIMTRTFNLSLCNATSDTMSTLDIELNQLKLSKRFGNNLTSILTSSKLCLRFTCGLQSVRYQGGAQTLKLVSQQSELINTTSTQLTYNSSMLLRSKSVEIIVVQTWVYFPIGEDYHLDNACLQMNLYKIKLVNESTYDRNMACIKLYVRLYFTCSRILYINNDVEYSELTLRILASLTMNNYLSSFENFLWLNSSCLDWSYYFSNTVYNFINQSGHLLEKLWSAEKIQKRLFNSSILISWSSTVIDTRDIYLCYYIKYRPVLLNHECLQVLYKSIEDLHSTSMFGKPVSLLYENLYLIKLFTINDICKSNCNFKLTFAVVLPTTKLIKSPLQLPLTCDDPFTFEQCVRFIKCSGGSENVVGAYNVRAPSSDLPIMTFMQQNLTALMFIVNNDLLLSDILSYCINADIENKAEVSLISMICNFDILNKTYEIYCTPTLVLQSISIRFSLLLYFSSFKVYIENQINGNFILTFDVLFKETEFSDDNYILVKNCDATFNKWSSINNYALFMRVVVIQPKLTIAPLNVLISQKQVRLFLNSNFHFENCSEVSPVRRNGGDIPVAIKVGSKLSQTYFIDNNYSTASIRKSYLSMQKSPRNQVCGRQIIMPAFARTRDSWESVLYFMSRSTRPFQLIVPCDKLVAIDASCDIMVTSVSKPINRCGSRSPCDIMVAAKGQMACGGLIINYQIEGEDNYNNLNDLVRLLRLMLRQLLDNCSVLIIISSAQLIITLLITNSFVELKFCSRGEVNKVIKGLRKIIQKLKNLRRFSKNAIKVRRVKQQKICPKLLRRKLAIDVYDNRNPILKSKKTLTQFQFGIIHLTTLLVLWNTFMLDHVSEKASLHYLHFCLGIAAIHCYDRTNNHAAKRQAFRRTSKKHLRQLIQTEQQFSIVELLLQYDVETNPGPENNDDDHKPRLETGAVGGLPRLAPFPLKPTRSSVDRWIHSVKARVKIQKWTPVQTVAYMGSLLTGPASDLFYSLDEQKQADSTYLLKLLTEEFGDSVSAGTAQTDFLRASMELDESMVSFYWRLNDLCRLAFPQMEGDKDQVLQEAFLRGLPEHTQRSLAPLKFNTSREALRAAQRVEGYQSKDKPASSNELADPLYHLGARPKTQRPERQEPIPKASTKQVDNADDRLLSMEHRMDKLANTVTDALKLLTTRAPVNSYTPARSERPPYFGGHCFNCQQQGHRQQFCQKPRNNKRSMERRNAYMQQTSGIPETRSGLRIPTNYMGGRDTSPYGSGFDPRAPSFNPRNTRNNSLNY